MYLDKAIAPYTARTDALTLVILARGTRLARARLISYTFHYRHFPFNIPIIHPVRQQFYCQ
ncbi:MAG: hypothetical protein EBE86_016370 [Hormoscilla sp. GUM202]|nr:hypothetical protein [Hormoscilla sp. GUM202]